MTRPSLVEVEARRVHLTMDAWTAIHPLLAVLPLLIIGFMNLLFTRLIRRLYEPAIETELEGLARPLVTQLSGAVAIRAVTGALLVGILTVSHSRSVVVMMLQVADIQSRAGDRSLLRNVSSAALMQVGSQQLMHRISPWVSRR